MKFDSSFGHSFAVLQDKEYLRMMIDKRNALLNTKLFVYHSSSAIRLIDTNYLCCIGWKGQLSWKEFSNGSSTYRNKRLFSYRETTFEEVLQTVNDEVRDKLIFNLDLFRQDSV